MTAPPHLRGRFASASPRACSASQVRFDGGHKRDAFLTETFGRFVEWVPVCPEVECGLGTPREAMRLVRVERPPPPADGQDRRRSDGRMERFVAIARVGSWRRRICRGYVLKKDSPSCGLERVKVYDRRRSRRAGAALRRGARRALPVPARRRRRSAVRSAAPRYLRRAGVRLLAAARPV